MSLRSSVQSNKLSAGYNQTLRVPIAELADLVIQVLISRTVLIQWFEKINSPTKLSTFSFNS